MADGTSDELDVVVDAPQQGTRRRRWVLGAGALVALAIGAIAVFSGDPAADSTAPATAVSDVIPTESTSVSSTSFTSSDVPATPTETTSPRAGSSIVPASTDVFPVATDPSAVGSGGGGAVSDPPPAGGSSTSRTPTPFGLPPTNTYPYHSTGVDWPGFNVSDERCRAVLANQRVLEIPDMRGLTQQGANHAMDPIGMYSYCVNGTIFDTQFVTDAPTCHLDPAQVGTIATQSPRPGTRVKPGWTIIHFSFFGSQQCSQDPSTTAAAPTTAAPTTVAPATTVAPVTSAPAG